MRCCHYKKKSSAQKEASLTILKFACADYLSQVSPGKRSSQNPRKSTNTVTYESQSLWPQSLQTTGIFTHAQKWNASTPDDKALHRTSHYLRLLSKPRPENFPGNKSSSVCALMTWPEVTSQAPGTSYSDPRRWPRPPNKQADYLLAASINTTACLVSTIHRDNRGNIYITKNMSPIIINKQPCD